MHVCLFYRHGLGRTDYYILNDPELCFQEVLRKKVNSESTENKGAIKLESHEDILKFDKNEILVKLEKGEGTLKIEKVALKKENTEEKDTKPGDNKVELTIVKSDKEAEDSKVETAEKEDVKTEEETPEEKKEEIEPKEEAETKPEKTEEEPEKPVPEKEPTPPTPPPKSEETEKSLKAAAEETDLCSKQAAELKAMFPDLEVIQPLSRLSQIDTFVLREQRAGAALDFSETTVAQLFNNAVKWPKEYAIQVRLQHIIYAIGKTKLKIFISR